jgi:hypothetical protein
MLEESLFSLLLFVITFLHNFAYMMCEREEIILQL